MTLTELEGAALGLLWLRGPTTTYELRKMVLDSPTPHWSASAGTVYPLVEKLCRGRLISRSITEDKRGTRRLRITPAGKRAFKTWMLSYTPAVTGVPPDPVRTRVRFLEVLSPSEGDRFLVEVEKHLRARLSLMRGIREGETPSESLALLGARLSQEKRVEWITAVKKLAIASPRPPAARRRSR